MPSRTLQTLSWQGVSAKLVKLTLTALKQSHTVTPQLRTVIMQDHENIDPISPKRGIRVGKAFIANAVCKLTVVSGLFLCANSAEPAPPSGCYERQYDAAHLAVHPFQHVRPVSLAVKPMSGHDPWIASADLAI